LVKKSFLSKYKGRSNFNKNFFNVSDLNGSVKNHLEMKLHHLLRVEDKNSMMFGVEGRVPFLEKNIVELAVSIPSKYKVRNGEVKYVLKNALKDLLPKLILNRNNKIGYETPMNKWMRTNDFIDIMDAMIERNDQPMLEYLNLDYVKTCWEKHKSNKGDYSSEIWKYFYLTKWYNTYFNEKKTSL
jgi:asparagine synthase (glutamine-hydrolysing)